MKEKKLNFPNKIYEFEKLMLSYGGYCGDPIDSKIGQLFGLKKDQREVVEVVVRVQKDYIEIYRKY